MYTQTFLLRTQLISHWKTVLWPIVVWNNPAVKVITIWFAVMHFQLVTEDNWKFNLPGQRWLKPTSYYHPDFPQSTPSRLLPNKCHWWQMGKKRYSQAVRHLGARQGFLTPPVVRVSPRHSLKPLEVEISRLLHRRLLLQSSFYIKRFSDLWPSKLFDQCTVVLPNDLQWFQLFIRPLYLIMGKARDKELFR